ncbi:hexokinase-3-like isoform X2 [Camellia sinensis]|uniref:hexokinase-3-like isoform X2 n=1 Tax=Camellia sinensis TaxID=4442 RepID=UPI0010364211|nr:hexokinase-3-like isoform X2 [Camellia sinensis]
MGTLAGARYWDDDVSVTVILWTRTNACYIECIDAIPKLQGHNSTSGRTIINTEWGAFSNGFPLTQFDRDIDAESINPGEQALTTSPTKRFTTSSKFQFLRCPSLFLPLSFVWSRGSTRDCTGVHDSIVNQFLTKRVSDAKGMRNRQFLFYEDWLILFGKDRATGELAEDPADAATAMENEDANATTEEGEQSPVEQFSMNISDTDYSMSTVGNVPNRANSTKTGKKQARPAEGIPSELSEKEKNLGSFIENTNTTMVEIAHRIGYS